ncbi:MAG: phage capsid protein [Polyangiales bacterium]
MSTGLSTIFQIQFDEQIKAAYQGQGVLRPHVRVKSGVVGSSCKFRRYARGMATPRVPQTDVVPMGTSYAQPEATLSDWNAAEYTDVFDQQKTSVDEQPVVATNIAAAIGRREDQMVLDAMDAANASADVSTDVGDSATGLNLAKLRRAKRLLDQRAVPKDMRVFVHSAEGLEQMLGVTEVTSVDYNTVKALTNGELNTFLGFTFAMIEERDEGGLPKSSDIRTNYAADRLALGLAIGIDYRNEVNYIPEKTSWLANGLFSAGAVAIDPEGIIEVEVTEA